MLEISVVVPVYGCRSCLHALHKRLHASLSSITSSFELIFVDDSSPDGAWEDLSAMAESSPEVKAFGLSRNFGQDAAITAGLAKASGRWTVVLDCDLQEPPEAIPRLYAKAQEGYDLVRTTRSKRGHPRSRRWASRAYRRLFLGNDSGREYSTMSMLSREVVNAFVSMRDRDREYALVLDWLGFRSTSVEIEFAERADGPSAYTLRRLLNVALSGMFFRTTVLLRAVVFLGFLIAALGIGLAAFNVYYYFAGHQPAGYTSLAVLLLLLAGFIIISVGVVGLYVGRIFEQVKSRPLFIVSRTAGVTDAASQDILSERGTDDLSPTREPEAPSTASLE
jgi:polyisoprenyl-phosphate glycosyltransferase